MAELEKLGGKYRIPLQIARDERWTRLHCDHKGNYADDCIVDIVQKSRVSIASGSAIWRNINEYIRYTLSQPTIKL